MKLSPKRGAKKSKVIWIFLNVVRRVLLQQVPILVIKESEYVIHN